MVIASSLFPCIPLVFSPGLGAFRATPETPHLELPQPRESHGTISNDNPYKPS
jgi:hypothetical protein